MGRLPDEPFPVEKRPRIEDGYSVRFREDPTRWWQVVVHDERFVILVRQADFRPKGEYFYTIIDWERGLRGPCDRIGQGWDISTETLREDAQRLLTALNNNLEFKAKMERESKLGIKSWEHPEGYEMREVSHRNNVRINIIASGVRR